MATFQSVMRYDGGKGEVIPVKEEANTANDWRANDLVNFNSTGQIQLGAAGIIAGIAQSDSSGTTNEDVEMELLDPAGLYIIHAEASTTPSVNDIGLAWALVFATGACTLAASAGSNAEVYIVALHPADTPAAGTRVIVRFSTQKLFDSGYA